MDFSPITVLKITNIPIKQNYSISHKIGAFVKIKPCHDMYKGKTFLGVFIGDLPLSVNATFNSKTGELNIFASWYNPAIFVPDIGKIIFGVESWWNEIESPNDLKDITDADINNVWYVKALKQLQDNRKLESEAGK